MTSILNALQIVWMYKKPQLRQNGYILLFYFLFHHTGVFCKAFFFQEKPSSMLAMEFAYFQMSVTMTEVAGGHLNRRKRQIQLTSFMQSRS